jgi:cytoskeletal protein CcmA (bactofilin family)
MAAAAPVPSTPPVTPPPIPPLSGYVRLTGASRVPSVRALEWEARGFTKVLGDVETGTSTVSGSLAVGGRLTAGELDLSGTIRVDGEVQVSGALRARGTFRTGGGLFARNARLNGTTRVAGPLTVGETLQWRGSLEVGQDVRAAAVLFDGRFAIQGTLRARSISGQVETLSTVEAIEADCVEIRRRKPWLPFPIFVLPPPPWHELEVQRIKATEVHLAGVRVRRVKADRVWLGPDTHVEYVEGTIVERHKGAHVGPESESPPPPGLSR